MEDGINNNIEENTSNKKNTTLIIIIVILLILICGLVYYIYTNVLNNNEINNNTIEENNTEEVIDTDSDISNWLQDTKNKKVVTVLASTTCPHCKEYKPVITRISNTNNYTLYFFEIDTLSEDELNTVTNTYDIGFENAVPFTFITSNGKVLDEYLGYSTEDEIVTFLNKNLNVVDDEDEEETEVKKPVASNKTYYNKDNKLNGKNVNIKFTADYKPEDDYLTEVTYKILVNDKLAWSSVETDMGNYAEDSDFLDDYYFIKNISKIKDNNEKEYFIINFNMPEESGYYQLFVIVDEDGKGLFEFRQWISSIMYNISGANANRYQLTSNSCKTYFSDWACDDKRKPYSTYIMESDKIYFLECKEDENKLNEHIIQIKDGKIELTDSNDKYKISNVDELSGGGFSCPTYNKK